ncbi:hypothetical protein NX059_011244 [Plenodomus lindquistii]|nr:hypothetical protein NX059_011244 [Plenodomus lindquistii]
MSKQPARANGAATKRPTEDGGASPLSKSLHSLSLQRSLRSTAVADSSPDICPVCKSSRYLNPNMKFKVNPECYHKMCESCVDRIFGHGPAPCPIAGCARTLRKIKFREQTFADLEIEREVDIRHRVMRAFNKTEEDFETLRDFNDYLEQVEEINWNLILGIDVEATESRLRRWEDHQKAELNPNAISRREPDAKKGNAQRRGPNAASNPAEQTRTTNAEDTGFRFHGLKKRVAPPKEPPFDPAGGWSMAPQYFTLQDSYDVGWYAQYTDTYHLAGGYAVQDFCERTLLEAFGGLGVFIEDEIDARGRPTEDATLGTKQAALAAGNAKDVNMDDVF